MKWRGWEIKSYDEKERRGGRGAHLLLLAGEVPNAPAHVFEARAALAAVAGGDHLNPCPVEVGLVDPGHHLLHEVLCRVEVSPLPEVHRSRCRHLAVLDSATSSAVQDGLQVAIYPLVARHISHANSIPPTSPFPPSVTTLRHKIGNSFHQVHHVQPPSFSFVLPLQRETTPLLMTRVEEYFGFVSTYTLPCSSHFVSR